MAKNYLTKGKYEELIKELEFLKTVERKSIGEKLRHAKELGDLSENSEYEYIKEEQSALEKKIADLENLLKNIVIIDSERKIGGEKVVRIGSSVTLKKENKDTVVYKLVGSNESDPSRGLISNISPLGKILLGKKEGDAVYLEVKSGKVEYKILKIE
jgi:transcription elongation factor GreA